MSQGDKQHRGKLSKAVKDMWADKKLRAKRLKAITEGMKRANERRKLLQKENEHA